jgi:hypothetical protein
VTGELKTDTAFFLNILKQKKETIKNNNKFDLAFMASTILCQISFLLLKKKISRNEKLFCLKLFN